MKESIIKDKYYATYCDETSWRHYDLRSIDGQ